MSPSTNEQQQTHSTPSKHPTQLPPIIPPILPTINTDSRPPTPVAPEFSPITPKAPPAILANYSPQAAIESHTNAGAAPDGSIIEAAKSAIPPADFIPQPPPQPFSSEDSTDAIALRAAISSLQFQKQKAQDDIRSLEQIKKDALKQPELFKSELAAGKLKEQRLSIGNLQAILDHEGSDEDDEVTLGPSVGVKTELSQDQDQDHMDMDGKATQENNRPSKDNAAPFGRIPGPQNVVRMPYVNWDKYHISGEALDALHEHQRKWPGTAFKYGQDKGREHAIAAPYSPWLDTLDSPGQAGSGERRNDSVATPGATPTISEHPMETRRRQTQQ